MSFRACPTYLTMLGLALLHTACAPYVPAPSRSQPVISGLVVNGQAVRQTAGGEVRVIRQGQTLSPVYVGFSIEAGDQVETAGSAEAVVDLEPGVRSYLGVNTRVTLSSLRVDWGEVFVSIKGFFYQVRGYFDLETSDASAIAERTEYYVRVSARDVSYLVLDGTVRIQPKATGRPFPLGQGEKVILARGQPLRGPFPADPRELESIRRWKDRLEGMTSGLRGGSGAPPPPTILVPRVINLDEKSASAVLARAGLRVGRISSSSTGRAKPGEIIDQRPRERERVARDTAVDLVVEAPPPPIPVPRVIGRDQKEASVILARAGLRVGRISYTSRGTGKPGQIIDQRPREGERVAPNTAVDLVVYTFPIQ